MVSSFSLLKTETKTLFILFPKFIVVQFYPKARRNYSLKWINIQSVNNFLFLLNNLKIMNYRFLKESFKLSLNTLLENRFRSILSLLGISIGIMSIVIIFSVVNSLEKTLNQSVTTLGENVIYVQKWPWSSGKEYEWWKFFRNPNVNFDEFKFINEKSSLSQNIAFVFSDEINLENNNIKMRDVGYEIYKNLFAEESAVEKTISVGENNMIIIGVLEKQGESVVGVSRDYSVLIGNNYAKKIMKVNDPMILCKAKSNVKNSQLKLELKNLMRKIRKVRPLSNDNFALNESSIISNGLEKLFGTINLASWIIGSFSILVGGFGISNIMFVSVKERTKEIGIQKSLGSKNQFILTQFLSEAVVLCIVGGIIGILLSFFLIQLISSIIPFEVYISFKNIFLGLIVSSVIGIFSGFFPAYNASRLDPVEAIRS